MRRIANFALLGALGGLFTSGFASGANLSFSVGITPPAPIVETAPPPPAPGSVWTPGYWSWDGTRYVWVPGRYVVAPFPDAVWVGGRWVHRGPHWTWVDGHWHPR
jgi:WXXGXW repeat (2 copies)